MKAHSDWLYIVPWGMYKAVTYVKETYGNPTIILSENGMRGELDHPFQSMITGSNIVMIMNTGMDQPGNVTLPGALRDTVRINYYRRYIAKLKKAIDNGANVVGYFAWSLLDNFEWKLGYTSRFGLVYVDYTTLQRYPKNSAYWFRNMLKGSNNSSHSQR